MKYYFNFLAIFLTIILSYGNVSSQCNHPDDYTALRALYLSTNGHNWTNSTGWPDAATFIANPLPPFGTDLDTWNGVTCSSNRVTNLYLFNNNLDGIISPEINTLSELTQINLVQNQLIGGIPATISNLSQLQYLALGRNQLTGSIPTEIGSLSNLIELNLGNNQLSGTIPQTIGNISNLHNLNLGNNQITGAIPQEFGNLSNLESLILRLNSFSGAIPGFLGSFSSLQELELHGNQFIGTIPNELGNLTNLISLTLNSNQLNGSIPSDLGNLSNLALLWLNDNNLSGCLPIELLNLCPNLFDVNISNNPLLSTQSWTDFCNNQQGICEACPDYDVFIDISATNICEGETPFLSFFMPGGTPDASYTIDWTLGPNTIIETDLLSVNPTETTTYQFFSIIDENGCSPTSFTQQITVNVDPIENPIFTQVSPICSGGMITLPTTSINGITGTWSPSINNTTTTTYTFTPNPVAHPCAATAMMTVVVNPNQIPIFTQIPPVCFGGMITLPTISINGISGTWSPAFNNTITTTYTFTPNPVAHPCAAIAMMTIIIIPQETPAFTQISPICAGGSFTLPIISNNGISGTWSPVINNTVTTTYTFTPNPVVYPCATTAMMTIVVVNNSCAGASMINIPNDCTFTPVNGTTINACPALISGSACNLNNFPTVWYRVIIPNGSIGLGFQNLVGNPYINIFNNSCSTPIEFGNCITSDTELHSLSQGTYLLAVRNSDLGAPFSFDIKTIPFMANDDPCRIGFVSTPLMDGIPNVNQNNVCATEDNLCVGSVVENSLWYSFTLPVGFDRITINVTGLTSPSISLYEEANPCNQVPINEECNGDGMVEFNCLQPGTYHIMVGTSSANAGTFTITATQGNNAGPANDFCFNATPLNIGPADLCLPFSFTSSNINACPENLPAGSVFGACNFNTEETSWYVFTAPGMPGDMPNMDFTFTGYTGSGTPFMNLFNFNANCNALSPVENQCFQGLNTPFPNIGPLTPGQQYLIGISSIGDTGGDFNFDIKFNNFPENDNPNPSGPFPPFFLGLGSSHASTTCCALGFNDVNAGGQPLDLPNVYCSGSTHDGAVWYRYTTGDEAGFEINVVPSGLNPIAEPVTVEVLSGSTTNPTNVLFTPTSVNCGQAPATLLVGCFDPGEEVWIKVASANNDCGNFTITITEIDQCPLAEECPDIQAVITTNPTDPNCGDFTPVSVQGCLEAACPETNISLCGSNQLPTVWFQVNIDVNAVQLGTAIFSNGSWNPVWAIYYGDCGNLLPTNGGTIVMPIPCSNGDSNPDIHTVGTITDVLTYYIAVSGEGVIDDPTFTLNVWTSANCVSCIGEPGCNPVANWTITSRSSERPLNDPKFCPGEEVRVCVNYRYDASETGVDWFHGLIPDFGPGWDMTSFDPANVTASTGNPVWKDEDDGACAPYITEQMPYLCTYNDPVTGKLKLCHTGCQACPCAGPLLQGSPLPSGWFWNSNGGGGCPNDCSPATHYGIGSVVVPDLSFCVNLKVRTFTSEQECSDNRDLHFNFQTTSHGVSGCWDDPIVECKLDFAQIGPLWEIECTQLPVILGENKILCKEGNTNLLLTNADGNNNIIIDVEFTDNPDVSGENSHVFNGFGTINDFLVNNSSSIQTVSYIANSKLPGVLCSGRSDTFNITLYPEFIAETERSGTVCSVNNGNGPTDISLYSLLKPNYTIGGNWIQVSPLAPGLVIQTNGIVNFSGLSVGTVFSFEYHKSVTDTCTYIPARVSVTVLGCDCPDTDINCINCNLCNDSGILDLAGTIVNPATIGAGTWKVTGPGNTNIPLNGTILDATGLPAGLYRATYTLSPAPGGICPTFDEFAFNIRNKATAMIKSDTLICNGSLGIQRFPLASLVMSGAFGSWVDANDQAVTDLNPSVVGLANGSVLNYTYVVANALPCTNSRYPVIIRITDNCNCEPINLLNIPTVCTSTGNLDLKTFSDPKPGTWTATNPLLVINNGVLTLTGVPAGTYQLRYTLTNPVPGCLTFATRNISIVNPKTTGIALPAQFCTADPGSLIQLRDFIEGEDSGGIWTMTSSNNTGFNASSGTFNLSGRPSGTYLFRYTFPAQAPCQDESTLITVNISSGPTISAGNDVMVCEGETVTLNALGNGTTYVWSDGVEQNKSFVPVRTGYYTVSATDVNGCAAKDSVFILILDESQTLSTADDTIYVSTGNTYDIDLALNDEIFSDSFNITIGDIPSEYIRILTLDTKGKMRFEIKESFFETIIIDYELCDLCDHCATGRLFMLDEKLKDVILTTIITPGQSSNNTLRFSEDPIPDSELWIYNRWGQQIHHSRGYQNDWNGDGYPGGVYYYVLKLYGFTIKRALTVVK